MSETVNTDFKFSLFQSLSSVSWAEPDTTPGDKSG